MTDTLDAYNTTTEVLDLAWDQMVNDFDDFIGKPSGKGYWADVGQIFVGYKNAAVGTVTGLYHMVSNPGHPIYACCFATRAF